MQFLICTVYQLKILNGFCATSLSPSRYRAQPIWLLFPLRQSIIPALHVRNVLKVHKFNLDFPKTNFGLTFAELITEPLKLLSKIFSNLHAQNTRKLVEYTPLHCGKYLLRIHSCPLKFLSPLLNLNCILYLHQ